MTQELHGTSQEAPLLKIVIESYTSPLLELYLFIRELRKQRLQLFLQLSMKNEVQCSSDTNYVPVTYLQSGDVKMKKFATQEAIEV